MHTVYVPADRFRADLSRVGPRPRLAAIDASPACSRSRGRRDLVASGSRAKLPAEPIEDLRIDFEDGYGDRGDERGRRRGAAAARAGRGRSRAATAPPFGGIRFKCFEAPTRRRGRAHADLFLVDAPGAGGHPRRLRA